MSLPLYFIPDRYDFIWSQDILIQKILQRNKLRFKTTITPSSDRPRKQKIIISDFLEMYPAFLIGPHGTAMPLHNAWMKADGALNLFVFTNTSHLISSQISGKISKNFLILCFLHRVFFGNVTSFRKLIQFRNNYHCFCDIIADK